ncbi:DNA polymerase [Caproiciproducens galactitolivorans]|uniref:DNA-directed DNA polymerase n=1 Tax=Caproiciproducens galactitolivorans TaxID=642589 RepID=A0A4Z0Y9C9_9FIRM|nr:DNA polymerase [Caproiciproducens galactitolivorans]TGJ75503.1 DNA polymerase I, thermostable [Caproiciproducens galactitolivorans]
MIHHLNIDLETFSSVPIAKAGLYKYVQSPDFQILLLGYSIDGAPPIVVDLASGEKIPGELLRALNDPNVIKHAYNAAFEWYCLTSCKNNLITGNPIDSLPSWRDTMLHALYCGYPASLDVAGKALGLPEDKRKLATGKALIRTFCVPCKPTARNGNRTRTLPQHEPEKWELFKEYNRQDVITEQEIERRLSPFPVPPEVQHQWETDLRINSRGVAVDLDLIHGALECSDTVTVALAKEAVQLTGLDNPNSVAQLSRWLTKETGEEVADLRKDTVAAMLGSNLNSDDARRVLEIRQELSKTSVKKYTAMTDAVCDDGRVRGLLQFYGANRTGRWAGRIIQPQNLPQTHINGGMLDLARDLVKDQKIESLKLIYGSVPDTLSQLIRTALVPSPGHKFVDADFSAIEARVIAWLAGEEWVLDVFRSHGKIYEATASQMFGVPIEKIVKGQPEYALRQKGKVATLALGYQGGSGSLISMGALKMGISEEDLPDIVRRWRDSNKRIVDLWYSVENTAINVVQTGRPAGVRGLIFALEGDHTTDQFFLTITLPSGRKLYYAKPFLSPNQWGNDSLHYYGMNQTSKKWEVIDTYGGKLVENCVQAIARDCLAENIERLEAAGFPVVFHVHDEVVIDVKKEKANLDTVCQIMSQPIPWAPGLPLKADGWVGSYYTKD